MKLHELRRAVISRGIAKLDGKAYIAFLIEICVGKLVSRASKKELQHEISMLLRNLPNWTNKKFKRNKVHLLTKLPIRKSVDELHKFRNQMSMKLFQSS